MVAQLASSSCGLFDSAGGIEISRRCSFVSQIVGVGTVVNGLSAASYRITAQWSLYVPPDLAVPSTQCIYVFCVDLRTNSDYFPIQH
jgi:hypothetical protein